MHVSGCTIGSISLNDVSDIQFSASASVIGSSTEEDSFANHFLQAVEKSRSVTISSFDMAGLEAIMNTYQGSKTTFSITVPVASEASGTTTGMTFSDTTTTPACLVVSVDMGSSHNTEATGSVQLEFSSNGSLSGMSVAAT